MSRDWTPREFLSFEKANKQTNPNFSIYDLMRSTTWTLGDVTRQLHTEGEMARREQFPVIGKVFENRFDELYEALSKVPGGLELLKQRDKELLEYFDSGATHNEGYHVQWFNGTLDKGFYYNERNNELFLNAVLVDARQAFLTAPKVVVQEEPSEDMDLPWFDPARVTERGSLRMHIDQEDNKSTVCVDLFYDTAKPLDACDFECVYAAPAEKANVQEARWQLYELAQKLGIPAYDETRTALIHFPVKVALVNLGEGIHGDYDPQDPSDVNLLRFDVYACSEGVYEPVSDGSYCTELPASATPAEQEQALHILMEAFYKPLSQDISASIKKVAERMSYIGLDFLQPGLIAELPSKSRKPPLASQIESAESRKQTSNQENEHPEKSRKEDLSHGK